MQTVAPAENGNMRIIAVVMSGCLKAGMKLINSGPTKAFILRCDNKEYICVDLLFVHREDHEGPCTKHLRYECWQRKLGAVGRDDNPRQARPN